MTMNIRKDLQGNTTAWKMCGLDKTTCLTVFFDISSSEKLDPSGNINPQLYIHLLTSYQSPDCQKDCVLQP